MVPQRDCLPCDCHHCHVMSWIYLSTLTVSPSASLSTLGSQSFGSKLTVICRATGYPEVTISFTTTNIFASNKTGDPITNVTATPSVPFTTTRSITFYSITSFDCGSVTCTASNSDGTTTSTVTATPNVQVTGKVLQSVLR